MLSRTKSKISCPKSLVNGPKSKIHRPNFTVSGSKGKTVSKIRCERFNVRDPFSRPLVQSLNFVVQCNRFKRYVFRLRVLAFGQVGLLLRSIQHFILRQNRLAPWEEEGRGNGGTPSERFSRQLDPFGTPRRGVVPLRDASTCGKTP